MKNRTYIAYGSNLNLEQMKYRCPHSRPIGTAMLKDYELEFRGVATIVPKKGSSVPVLLWEISPQDEEAMNRYEGFPHLYQQEEHEIDLNGQKVSGMAYVMNGGEISPPSYGYHHTILQGYHENGMDVSYLNHALKNALMAHSQNTIQRNEEVSDFQLQLS